MIDLTEKQNVLDHLIADLHLLIKMLGLEPDVNRQFAPLFEPVLERAQELRSNGFELEDLKELSYLLEGLLHRNFLDYAPATFDTSTGRFSPIPGTEEYAEVLARVSASTLELRMIGRT
jgi:hypothetical protein